MEGGTSASWSVHVHGQGNWEAEWRTWAQSPLVDPAVHLGALLLQLLDPALHVGELALQLLNLLGVGPHGLVEGLGEQVGHGLCLHGGVHRGRGLAESGAVGQGACELGFLGLLGARIHVLVFGGEDLLLGLLELLLELLLGLVLQVGGQGVGRIRALLLVVVVGLGALRGVGFNVAVRTRSALEKHVEGEKRREAEGGGWWAVI